MSDINISMRVMWSGRLHVIARLHFHSIGGGGGRGEGGGDDLYRDRSDSFQAGNSTRIAASSRIETRAATILNCNVSAFDRIYLSIEVVLRFRMRLRKEKRGKRRREKGPVNRLAFAVYSSSFE